jgi:outer membrane receptor for ferrienterochelin and colicin
VIRAIPASLVVVFLLIAAPGAAQEGLEDEFALLEEALAEDEVESASKRRQSIYLSPSAVTVFTREDILASGAEDLWDLLRRAPNMDVYEMKPSYTIVGARALTDPASNLVLLLVDGREAMEELSGLPFWTSQTIDLDEIERVEVIRGPGSTLYGANAFAAVVNVTTLRERAAETARAHLSAGEQGQRHVFGSVRGTWTPGGGVLDLAAGLGCDGRRSPSDPAYDIRDIGIRSHATLRYRHGQRLDLSLHAGVLDGSGVVFVQMGDALTELLSHNTMVRLSALLTVGVRMIVV